MKNTRPLLSVQIVSFSLAVSLYVVSLPVLGRQLSIHAEVPLGGAIEDGLQTFAAKLKEATKGAYFVKLKLGARAGTPQQMLARVQEGSIDAALISGRAWDQTLDFRFAEIPFGLSEQKIELALQDNHSHFVNLSAKSGLQLLGAIHGSSIFALSTVKIGDTVELKGKKLMLLEEDPILGVFAHHFGMTKVKSRLANVLKKLGSGEVQVAYGPLLPMLALQWLESDRYLWKTPIAQNVLWFVANPTKWEALAKEIPGLSQLVLEFTTNSSEAAKKEAKGLVQDLPQLGVKVISVDDSKHLMHSFGKKIRGKLLPKMSAKMQTIINQGLK